MLYNQTISTNHKPSLIPSFLNFNKTHIHKQYGNHANQETLPLTLFRSSCLNRYGKDHKEYTRRLNIIGQINLPEVSIVVFCQHTEKKLLLVATTFPFSFFCDFWWLEKNILPMTSINFIIFSTNKITEIWAGFWKEAALPPASHALHKALSSKILFFWWSMHKSLSGRFNKTNLVQVNPLTSLPTITN